MNSSPEYEVPLDTAQTSDAFLPLVLISVSFIILFVWQLTNISSQRANFQNTIARQDEMVKQSHQLQASLEKIVLDVIELQRAGDPDATALVQKYGIQQNAPPQIPLR